MGYDRTARRDVVLSLNADLVEQACRVDPDLSRVVQGLLADWVRQRAQEEQTKIDASLNGLNAFYEEHGLVGEEYMPI